MITEILVGNKYWRTLKYPYNLNFKQTALPKKIIFKKKTRFNTFFTCCNQYLTLFLKFRNKKLKYKERTCKNQWSIYLFAFFSYLIKCLLYFQCTSYRLKFMYLLIVFFFNIATCIDRWRQSIWAHVFLPVIGISHYLVDFKIGNFLFSNSFVPLTECICTLYCNFI